MTKSIPYWHVDAFASEPFTGNQAAVMVLDEWLADDVLVKIGGENMFAETAFVVRDATAPEDGGADWELRWTTPTYEIALCGHATLAAGHVLLSHHEWGAGKDRVRFRTRKSGILEVRRSGDGYEVGLPAIHTEPRAHPEAVKLLGAEPLLVHRNDTLYNIFLFENEAQVRALDPDLRGLAALGVDQFDCTAPGSGGGDNSDIVSRVFVPGAGVDEDSVTGSAHAALTPFWAERLGRTSFTAHQASQRGGNLTCALDGDRVWLGGPCTTVVAGEFYI